MALDQSALLALLGALRSSDNGDLVRQPPRDFPTALAESIDEH